MWACIIYICMHVQYGGKNTYVCIQENMLESIYAYVSKNVCKETGMNMYLYVHEYMYVCGCMYVG